jgi:hypothetical protein
MNQHGAPSAASPHHVKRAVAAKQCRLNTVCNPGLLKDFTFGLTSNFFHASLGLLPRLLNTFESRLWKPGIRVGFWRYSLLALKIHARTLASSNRPHSQPSIRFAGCNDLLDLAARVDNTNFTAAVFRAARLSLRFYDHLCPDVSGVIKLACFPIGHPNASM